jgi:hypothetical protein
MIKKFYTSHIRTALDAAAINVWRERPAALKQRMDERLLVSYEADQQELPLRQFGCSFISPICNPSNPCNSATTARTYLTI